MSGRRANASSVFSSPVLIGSITTLILVIAVFLSYHANNGLPFVPTRQMNVEFRNGLELVKGNDVREGGFRVGSVESMKPARLPDGQIGALATLKLDKSAGAFPVDSVATIRPKTALGLEYVELTRGSSSQTIPDGGYLALGQTRQQPELDQVYSMFDAPTRQAARVDLQEFGNALTGRGADLSQTIQALPRTLGLLAEVARNLGSPDTQLAALFPALERTAGAIAPVAGEFGTTFTYMADTFAAISADPRALRQTIEKTPGTLAVGTRSLAVQLPFLRDSAAFASDLNRATIELRRALPDLNSALRVGVPVTRRSLGLYKDLQGALGALLDLAQAPQTNAALRGLTATVGTLQPQLRYLGPLVTVCNYWNIWWGMVSEHLSANTGEGTAQRALVNIGTQQNNSYGSAGAAVPANGEGVVPGTGVPIFLHNQPYGHAVNDSGTADCINGQAGVTQRMFKNGPSRFKIATDSYANDQFGYPLGSTYGTFLKGGGFGQGRSSNQVPSGQTYTTKPGGIAAQLP
jgi:virulence factor Mce-like protein